MQRSQSPPAHARQGSGQSTTSSDGIAPGHRKKPSLLNIAVQPFAAFRAQTSQVPQPSPVRRKPLPPNASPAIRSPSVGVPPTNSLGDKVQAQRSVSVDAKPNPIPQRPAQELSPPPSGLVADFLPRNLDKDPHGSTPAPSPAVIKSGAAAQGEAPRSTPVDSAVSLPGERLRPVGYERDESTAHGSQNSVSSQAEGQQSWFHSLTHSRSASNMSKGSGGRPDLALRLDGLPESAEGGPMKQPPKSPGHKKLTSFFGWKPGNDSPTTDTTNFSNQSGSPRPSPMPSPIYQNPPRSPLHPRREVPTSLDIPAANSYGYFPEADLDSAPSSPSRGTDFEELELELKDVSSELAQSIKREMELEEELERLRTEMPIAPPSNLDRRTSDYYSDSGASSARYPTGDSESKIGQLEKLRRKAEQEKAQLKLDMVERLQEEVKRRRDLEVRTQELERQLKSQDPGANASEKLQELENSLENLRRRLAEERAQRESYEALFPALKEELEKNSNERDNLRDEVVPQLRAQLDGLETNAAEAEKLTYENTRMQQELQNLRNEKETMLNARRMQLQMQQQSSRFMQSTIAEEGDGTSALKSPVGLTRSNSLARSPNLGRNARAGSLSRSDSVKDKSGSGNAEVKELEEQRDALHRALKALILRQEHQVKEHQKQVKALMKERDEALAATPRRATFQREVKMLRAEVDTLRRRADDVLDQKWQYEKNLTGVKMDLDRAEQETTSLRDILKVDGSPSKGSEAFEKVFQDLRTTQAQSITWLKDKGADGGEPRLMELLRQSISDTEAERDAARREAEQYRQQAMKLQASEVEHLSKEQSLASQIFASTTSMDEISARAEKQMRANQELKDRLAQAIERGEREQQSSAQRIADMQSKLRSLEERVMHAQSHSEELIAAHEDEVKQLKDSSSAQLQRGKNGLLSPSRSTSPPKSPLFGLRSPKLDTTSSGAGMSMAEASKTESLEKRVADLEKALSEADTDMQEVVGKMSAAQIEVFELQSQKDDAERKTAALQKEMQAEREKVKELMAKSQTQ